MYKRILVPLDGSRRAEKILRHAEELAHHFDAEIIFLQVVSLIWPNFSTHGTYLALDEIFFDQKRKEANLYLTALTGEFREKGIQARAVTEVGSIVSSIIKIAERENVGLIAMTSHGRSGISHVFYGSVAEGVLHRINRPLLLIHSIDEKDTHDEMNFDQYERAGRLGTPKPL